jgi:hypothetical protein
MKFINTTPHTITEVTTGISFFKDEACQVRVNETFVPLGTLGQESVPIFQRDFGQVENLPAPSPDIIYIVSFLVKQALPDRRDLISPGELVRDAQGCPIGCKGFIQ